MLRNLLVFGLIVVGAASASQAFATQASPSDTVSVMQGTVPQVAAKVVAPCAGCTPVVEPSCAAPVVKTCCKPCCPTPCIAYRTLGERRSCLACKPKVQLTVLVKNPQTCCEVLVPICVPCCCVDTPCVDSRRGMFHRGIVTHTHKCGLRIDFVFDKQGDLLVTYRY